MINKLLNALVGTYQLISALIFILFLFDIKKITKPH